MKSSLQTLTRIQKFQIDEQRKILNGCLAEEEELVAGLSELNRQFSEQKRFAQDNPGVGDFGTYTRRYLQEREAFETKIAAVRRKIEEIRDIIADLFKEQKTYEIVDENRRKRTEKEENAKEQKTLDEIGTNNFIRNKNKN